MPCHEPGERADSGPEGDSGAGGAQRRWPPRAPGRSPSGRDDSLHRLERKVLSLDRRVDGQHALALAVAGEAGEDQVLVAEMRAAVEQREPRAQGRAVEAADPGIAVEGPAPQRVQAQAELVVGAEERAGVVEIREHPRGNAELV